MIYQNATARIKDANGTQSEPFDVQRGVLQGDILSPILFVLVLNSTWARTNPANGWQITPSWLLDELSYADDCVIIEGPAAPTVPPAPNANPFDNSQLAAPSAGVACLYDAWLVRNMYHEHRCLMII